jgi:hypothetical protein
MRPKLLSFLLNQQANELSMFWHIVCSVVTDVYVVDRVVGHVTASSSNTCDDSVLRRGILVPASPLFYRFQAPLVCSRPKFEPVFGFSVQSVSVTRQGVQVVGGSPFHCI